MRRAPAPRPPRRPVFVPFVRRTTRTASRVAHEQLQRHQARRRQRRAKLRSWRPRQGATHRRLIALLAALVLVFLVVGARLVDLQAIGRDRYAQLGLDQRVRKVQLAAERGSVFDRNGHDLAASVPQQTVWANPRVVTDPAAYAAQLAPIVGGDEASLRDRLSQHDKGFVYVARKVDSATVVEGEGARRSTASASCPSRSASTRMARSPARFSASSAPTTAGSAGSSPQYNGQLAGKRGELQVERDPQGRQLPGGEQRVAQSQRGSDLVLTIDQCLQYQSEQVLGGRSRQGEREGRHGDRRWTSRTGDILAMVNVEGGPRRIIRRRPRRPTEQNRPVAGRVRAGIDEQGDHDGGRARRRRGGPDTVIPDPGSADPIGGTRVRRTSRLHPASMTVADILRESSNVGTIQIARDARQGALRRRPASVRLRPADRPRVPG